MPGNETTATPLLSVSGYPTQNADTSVIPQAPAEGQKNPSCNCGGSENCTKEDMSFITTLLTIIFAAIFLVVQQIDEDPYENDTATQLGCHEHKNQENCTKEYNSNFTEDNTGRFCCPTLHIAIINIAMNISAGKDDRFRDAQLLSFSDIAGFVCLFIAFCATFYSMSKRNEKKSTPSHQNQAIVYNSLYQQPGIVETSLPINNAEPNTSDNSHYQAMSSSNG